MITNTIIAITTAYCSCTICCGPNAANITAKGTTPLQGRTLAAPRAIPLGSKAIINGHTYIVEDRTSKRFDGRWDIYMSSHKQAKEFGIRTNQTITIITK